MSSLRGRTRDSSWQWLAIGVILGMGCFSVLCLFGYATGVVTINMASLGQQPATPTLAVMIVTATPAPVTPSQTPIPTVPLAAAPSSTLPTTLIPTIPTITPFVLQPTSLTSQPPATNIPLPTASRQASPSTPPPVAPATAGASDGGTRLAPEIVPGELIAIEGGQFKMGTDAPEMTRAVEDCKDRDKGLRCDLAELEDAFPIHDVTLNAFRIEKYEVTHQQYADFLNYLGPRSHLNGCGGNPCAAIQGPSAQPGANPQSQIKFDGTKYTVLTELYVNRPIRFVTWYGADMYCRAISRRLPTEAEWERAARGKEGRLYPWGVAWEATRARTSRPTNQGGPDEVTAFPTGATPDGIFNMAGNVSEWVNDWYSERYYRDVQPNALDPKGPATGTRKVYRGGDWDALPLYARAVHRRDEDPAQVRGHIGFRCAADQDLNAPPPGSGSTARPTSTPASLAPGTGN